MKAVVFHEEGNALECGRAAAGHTADFLPATFLLRVLPKYLAHGKVIVLPVGVTFAAAVLQYYCLIALVAKIQLSHSQLQPPQRTGLRFVGSFSPSGLVVHKGLVPLSLLFN